jgi:tRNA G10  N-methylase Trm11
MINILGLKKGDTLLDPFCGTGTFLMQGLLCNFNVIGSDKNKQMIDCARKNTKWVKTEFKLKNTFDIIIKDSRFLDFKADGVVFEPYMGKFLDKRPNPVYAKKLIKELEELYFDIFKNLSKYLKKNNKVVFIFPEFITFNEQKFNISQKVFLDNNFEILDSNKIDSNLNIKFPIDYETPSGSKLNRKIYVIVKK